MSTLMHGKGIGDSSSANLGIVMIFVGDSMCWITQRLNSSWVDRSAWAKWVCFFFNVNVAMTILNAKHGEVHKTFSGGIAFAFLFYSMQNME